MSSEIIRLYLRHLFKTNINIIQNAEETLLMIEFASESDYNFIIERDKHIKKELVKQKIISQEIYIIRKENQSIGWMRYSYFWDNTPFMNLIWLDEPYRHLGIGKQVVLKWEGHMKAKGFKLVMTSTQADEQAQHFYRKLGYKDSGCLMFDDQPLEIILTKHL